MNMEMFRKLVVLNEGKRNQMYKDSLGIETIGIGHNLRDKPVSDRAVYVIFEDDMAEIFPQLDKHVPWWRDLDDARQCAIADMAFQMGIGGLLGFRNTLALIRAGQYTDAAVAMRESKWHTQTPVRAERIALIMETGVLS